MGLFDKKYCDVCGESLANCTCRMPDADKVKRVYILQNLGCANCAAKMEYKIKELPEGEIVILLDTDTSLENVKRAAGSKGWKVVDLQEEGEDYRLTIGK